MKKPPQKAEIPSFQKFSFSSPTAQKADFMLQNVAYRATVYRTGYLDSSILSYNHSISMVSS